MLQGVPAMAAWQPISELMTQVGSLLASRVQADGSCVAEAAIWSHLM
jgi:hypothetical protein